MNVSSRFVNKIEQTTNFFRIVWQSASICYINEFGREKNVWTERRTQLDFIRTSSKMFSSHRYNDTMHALTVTSKIPKVGTFTFFRTDLSDFLQGSIKRAQKVPFFVVGLYSISNIIQLTFPHVAWSTAHLSLRFKLADVLYVWPLIANYTWTSKWSGLNQYQQCFNF